MLTRALIVMLVALNLGVAAWWAWRPAPQADTTVEPPSGIARLRLLSERPGAPPPRPSETRSAATSPAASTTTAAAPEQPTLEADVPKAERCYRFGPFADDAAIAAARRALQPKVARLREESAPAERSRGWRVILPPAADRDAANAVGERLKLAGFRDFFVVASGTETNAIMLGRFGSEERARLHAASLRDAGFAAQAEPLGEAKPPERWLLATVGEGLDSVALDSVALARSSGAARAQPVDCPAAR